LSSLKRLGIRTVIGYSAQAEVLIIQKRINKKIVALAHEHRKRGGRLLYDCDDLGAPLDYWAPPALRQQLASIVDLITTNTREFKTALERLYSRPVEIIPDAIDYYLTEPIAKPPCAPPSGNLRVLWFGNNDNLRMLCPYLPIFLASPGCSLTVCTGSEALQQIASFPAITFAEWTLQGFPFILRSTDLTFLPHGHGDADWAKSNNRMVTSIAWGVPAIVSRTPAYERTALSAGVEKACFQNIQEARSCMERLRSLKSREAYLERAQPTVWRVHSPDAVAKVWCEILSGMSD
jgi:hypothetical protein